MALEDGHWGGGVALPVQFEQGLASLQKQKYGETTHGENSFASRILAESEESKKEENEREGSIERSTEILRNKNWVTGLFT